MGFSKSQKKVKKSQKSVKICCGAKPRGPEKIFDQKLTFLTPLNQHLSKLVGLKPQKWPKSEKKGQKRGPKRGQKRGQKVTFLTPQRSVFDPLKSRFSKSDKKSYCSIRGW